MGEYGMDLVVYYKFLGGSFSSAPSEPTGPVVKILRKLFCPRPRAEAPQDYPYWHVRSPSRPVLGREWDRGAHDGLNRDVRFRVSPGTGPFVSSLAIQS